VGALKNLALLMEYSDVQINSLCAVSSGGSFNTIAGNAKLDFDKNGCDDNDENYSHLKIKYCNSENCGYVITDEKGNFSINLESGSYDFEPLLDHPEYFISLPSSANFNLPDTISSSFCIS